MCVCVCVCVGRFIPVGRARKDFEALILNDLWFAHAHSKTIIVSSCLPTRAFISGLSFENLETADQAKPLSSEGR